MKNQMLSSKLSSEKVWIHQKIEKSPQKKRKKMYGKNKFMKSEVKGNKFWNHEQKVYKANSTKSNTIDIYGKVPY